MNNYLITPDSDIYLLKCPLEMDSRHQIDFNNASAQQTYFQSLPKVLMDNATYMRKDGRLYFEGSFDTYLPYNYCMYRNNGYSTKWFYAFVTDLRFESNNSCSCNLITDVFQTWLFDYTINKSFCERFMPAKQYDTIGRYTFPEGLELGDYVCNNYTEISDLKNQKMVVGSTADYVNLNNSSNGIYQNIPTGCGYYAFDLTTYDIDVVRQWLQDLTDATKESAIVSLFLAPTFLCATPQGSRKITNSTQAEVLDVTITNAVAGLNGYIPRNNKLYTYPYYYTLVTNGAGGSCILKPELWDSSTHTFRVYASLTPGCSIIGVPMNYAGHDIGWEEALPLGKYPQLNYSTDQFTNWQTQNGLNNTYQKLQGAMTLFNAFGNLPTQQTPRMGEDLMQSSQQGIGGAYQIMNAIHQEQLAELVPAQFAGNVNCGDVWSSAKEITYRFNFMSIRAEFAQIIDLFFDMYGYKVNRLMTINTKTRSEWNYVKTIEANITGDIPEQDMQRLKELFNGGFTIWHNPAHYLDYSQTNN